jgi:hypothetical protein
MWSIRRCQCYADLLARAVARRSGRTAGLAAGKSRPPHLTMLQYLQTMSLLRDTMNIFNRHRRTIVIGILSILVVAGILLVRQSARTLYDRQFGVPEPVNLTAVASNPAAYEDRYIQVEGELRFYGRAVCDGLTLLSPGSYMLQTGKTGITVDAMLRGPIRFNEKPHMPVIISGWVRRWDGLVGCDARHLGGRNDTRYTTAWYFEPMGIWLKREALNRILMRNSISLRRAAAPPIIELY